MAFLVNVLQPTGSSGGGGSGGGMAVNNNRTTFEDFRKYYLHGGWQRGFRELALGRLRFVHRWLDREVLEAWGYAAWEEGLPQGPHGASLAAGSAGIGGGTAATSPFGGGGAGSAGSGGGGGGVDMIATRAAS